MTRMPRHHRSPIAGLLLAITAVGLAGCSELQSMGLDFEAPDIGLADTFSNLAGPDRHAVAMLAAVDEKPVTAFRARPHLGVEIQTQGYSRRPYFLEPPAQIQFTPRTCDQIYLAGDAGGTASLRINNLLLIELQQGNRQQALAVGTTEPLVYHHRQVPFLTARRNVFAGGEIRLERLLQPGQPVTLTLTPLTNGDSGGVSNIFLVIDNYGEPQTDDKGVSRCPNAPGDRRNAQPAQTQSPQAQPVLQQPGDATIQNRPQAVPARPATLPPGYSADPNARLPKTRPPEPQPDDGKSTGSSSDSDSFLGLPIKSEPTSLPDRVDP